MRFDYLPEDLGNIWQELDTNPVQLSPEQILRETALLRKGVGRRTVLIGVIGLFLIAGFSLLFFIFHNWLQRVGSVVTIAGVVFLVVQVRMMRVLTTPDSGETDCLKFYRAELERQRDFHRGMWFWSRMLTFLPGPIVFMLGFAQAYPKLAAGIRLELAVFLLLGVIAIPLNLRLARKYQRRIDALDRSQKGE